MAGTAPPDMSDTKFEADPTPDAAGGEDVGDPTFGVDEKKLVAKLDRHLVPLVMLLYTFSFLDRYVVLLLYNKHTTYIHTMAKLLFADNFHPPSVSISAMRACMIWKATWGWWATSTKLLCRSSS